MKRTLRLLPLTALFTLLSAGAARAAEWHDVESGSPARDVTAFSGVQDAARAYLKRSIKEFRLEGIELRFKNNLAVGDSRTVRFEQQYRGLPVFGASAAVHLTSDHRVKAVSLEVARGLSVSPTPSVHEDDARKAIEGTLGMSVAANLTARLGVLAEEEGPGKLVWSVDVPSEHGGERYFVDAHNGNVLSHRPLAIDVLGRVYKLSSANTPVPADVELNDLVVSTPQKLTGWDGNLTVTNYVSGGGMGGPGGENPPPLVLEQSLTPSVGGDFLYDPPADPLDDKDAFAQVGIYYHLSRMRDYFTTTHGVDMSPASWKLTAVANMLDDGQPLDNAYFSPEGVGEPWNTPNLIAIGQGSQFDFSGDSDVFLHEFTHYVAGNAIGYNAGQLAATQYGLSPWGGSIDEGTADYFACTVNGDPLLGEASLVPLGAARDLSKASKKCPDDLIGEVHADGELIGSLSWSLRTALGAKLGDKLIWGAMTMLHKGSSFGDFGRGLRMTAADLVAGGELTAADVKTVDDLLKARGMDDCDPVLDLGGGKSRRTAMFGLDALGRATGGGCGQLRQAGLALQSLFHFKRTPAATAGGIRFKIDLESSTGGDLNWSIYVRAGQHVGFSSSGSLPKVSKFDYKIENIKQTAGEIVIDATSNPPFDAKQTYYVVIGHTNCPTTVASVSAEDVKLAPVDPGNDATPPGGTMNPGVTDPAGEKSAANETVGCACRVDGPSSPASPWAALSGLAVAGLAMLRRRSARRSKRG